MSNEHRRDFLKRSAAVVSAASLAKCAPTGGSDDATAGDATAAAAELDTRLLRAIGEAVLPVSDLGAGGVERTIAGFQEWVDGFEPVAEQPHGYLNRGLSEIRYGPPHPGPRWAAQLEALELEARRRLRSSLEELDIQQRRDLIAAQLDLDELRRMPSPARAEHVAMGLVAYFYDTSEANDLCHRAAIGRHTCRGLESAADEPAPLGGEA